MDDLTGVPDIPLALAFDDVLLVPRYSEIASRTQVDTRSRLAGDLWLQWPIVLSNMDTVASADSAIAAAAAGGVCLLHRFQPIEGNVAEIHKVKRYRSHVIEDPYHVAPEATCAHAVGLMDEHGVGGLMVAGGDGRLRGIITRRDVWGMGGDERVEERMTPLDRMITGHPSTSPEQAARQMHARRVEKLPLLDGEGHCVGLIVMKDIKKLADHPRATLDASGSLVVGASIGVVGDYVDRLDACVAAGADVIVVDVAHGWAAHVIDAVRLVRDRHPDLPLIVGNVATGPGLAALCEAAGRGVGVRCGVGAGSACDTRQVAGAGVASVTSIMSCVHAAREHDATIIADGGIRIGADVAKAIGAGAHAVMAGGLFAAAAEAPGEVVTRDGYRYKAYRGMASREAAVARYAGRLEKLTDDFTPEGVESAVRYHGDTVEQIMRPLIGGLKSGMSYAGASSIEEFHARARFTRITQAGLGESRTHVKDRV